MPYIETNWNEQASSSAIHMYPSQKSLSNMLIAMVKSKEWSGFTIMYESPNWLLRSSDLLEVYGPRDDAITLRHLKPKPGDNTYREVLKQVKRSKESKIILECSTKILNDVMNQMLQVGLLNEDTQLIITNLDLHTIDLVPFQHIEANITGFRITDGKSEYMNGLRSYMNGKEIITFSPDSVLLHDAVIFDGILLYAEAVKTLKKELLASVNLSCRDDSTFRNGYSVSNHIKLVSKHTLSHTVLLGVTSIELLTE